MTRTEKQNWEQVRAEGRDRYIVREGLLRRGVPFGILFGLSHVVLHISHDSMLSIVARWGLGTGFTAVGFGASMGLHYWQQHERDYQKPTEDDDVVEKT